MLGSWWLGGDQFSGVGIDVVEVGVVVVVVVGVVRRHLLDAGGDAPHRLHVRLRGRPAPRPPPIAPPSPRLRRLNLHGQNNTKCTQFGPCKKIVFHRLCFLKTEYYPKESIFLTVCAILCLFTDSRKQKKL